MPPRVPRLLDQEEDALAPNPPCDLAQGGVVVGRARRRHRRGPLGFPPRRSLPGRRPRERRVPPQRARARSHRHLPRRRRRARARGDAQAQGQRPLHRLHPGRHRGHTNRLRRRHHGGLHALLRHRPALRVGRHGTHRSISERREGRSRCVRIVSAARRTFPRRDHRRVQRSRQARVRHQPPQALHRPRALRGARPRRVAIEG